jgi:hypothetical protein
VIFFLFTAKTWLRLPGGLSAPVCRQAGKAWQSGIADLTVGESLIYQKSWFSQQGRKGSGFWWFANQN